MNTKDLNLVTLAALAAKGEFDKLHDAIQDAFKAGLTINDMRETFIQVSGYAGFPRCINSLATLMKIVKAMEAAGQKPETGKEPDPLPAGAKEEEIGNDMRTYLMGHPGISPVCEFFPVLNVFLEKHIFCDIYSRNSLDVRTHEIITIACIATLPDCVKQLHVHLAIALNIGITADEIKAIAKELGQKTGTAESDLLNQEIDKLIANPQKPTFG